MCAFYIFLRSKNLRLAVSHQLIGGGPLVGKSPNQGCHLGVTWLANVIHVRGHLPPHLDEERKNDTKLCEHVLLDQ